MLLDRIEITSLYRDKVEEESKKLKNIMDTLEKFYREIIKFPREKIVCGAIFITLRRLLEDYPFYLRRILISEGIYDVTSALDIIAASLTSQILNLSKDEVDFLVDDLRSIVNVFKSILEKLHLKLIVDVPKYDRKYLLRMKKLLHEKKHDWKELIALNIPKDLLEYVSVVWLYYWILEDNGMSLSVLEYVYECIDKIISLSARTLELDPAYVMSKLSKLRENAEYSEKMIPLPWDV